MQSTTTRSPCPVRFDFSADVGSGDGAGVRRGDERLHANYDTDSDYWAEPAG